MVLTPSIDAFIGKQKNLLQVQDLWQSIHMKSPTQMKVLSAVWRTPGLSRSDLEGETGFHMNTITQTVGALLRKGYLREGDTRKQGRGRPRIPLEVDPGRTCVGGIAIGVGAVEAVTLNLLGQPQGKISRVEADSPERITRAVSEQLRNLLLSNPLALGVSVPGFVDPEKMRILFSAAMPGREVDLEPFFRRVGETPVVLNTDVHALATRWLMNHVEAEHEDSLVVTLEDGAVGASMLVEGRPNKGCVLGGNELGHMNLCVETAHCYCGGTGCVERIFSTDFLHRSGGTGDLASAFSGKAISKAAQHVIDLTAIGLANATVFARPHRVVIAGILGKQRVFREALEGAWRKGLPPVFRERVKLEWYETQATVSAETAGWLAIARIVCGVPKTR